MEKKKSILNCLKGNINYLNDDILKVCLKNNVFDAAIYIYLFQENFTEALNLCKKEISNNIDSLIQIYIDKNAQKKKEIITEHDEIINKCCYICEKENEQLPKKERKKIWFDILNFLYKKIELINITQKKKNIKFESISTKISEDINIFILKMYPYTDMKSLLEEIFKKTQMTEFSGLNNILVRFVKEQIIYKNIFNKIKSILDYSISSNYKEKNKYNIKGINYLIEECNFCHKIFNDNENILLLKCGHIVHKNNECCININNKYTNCRICYNQNLKKSVGSIEEKNIEIFDKIDNYIENDKINEKKMENKSDKINFKEKYNKLNIIEDKLNKRNNILDVDIEIIKANKNKDKKK